MSVLVQTRIDPQIKVESAAILKQMGLTISDAVRLMLVRVAREKTLPFDVWRPNAETLAAMNDIENGKLEELSLEELKAQLDEID